jgi:hypothetical protein
MYRIRDSVLPALHLLLSVHLLTVLLLLNRVVRRTGFIREADYL